MAEQRLIDANALKLSMITIEPSEMVNYCYPCKEALKAIDDAPTIEERTTGKWICKSPMTMNCNKCRFVIENWEHSKYNYCPNCGADMRGEEHEGFDRKTGGD